MAFDVFAATAGNDKKVRLSQSEMFSLVSFRANVENIFAHFLDAGPEHHDVEISKHGKKA